MDRDQFIAIVAEAARTDTDTADRMIRATLQTLAERIVRGQADDLAAQLPAEVAPWLHKPVPEAGRFDVDEFLRRVSERAGVDLATAERASKAVLTALQRAVSPKEYDDLVAELPRDFARLLPRGPSAGHLGSDEFVERVAELTGLDTSSARRATEAVLETLAERISGGEVRDLIAVLPPELHAPLKVGDGLSSGAARQMSLDEFVHRVADREGVSPQDAREHTRAVLATLREVAGDEEFFDVVSQLPDEYAPVLARR